MALTVNIHEAKTHLSRLLVQVAAGEEIIIARNGTPLAKLVSILPMKRREPGRFAGQILIHEDLLAPMTPEELALWEEGHANDPLRRSAP